MFCLNIQRYIQSIVADLGTFDVNFWVFGSLLDPSKSALPGAWSPSMTIAQHVSSSQAALICVLIAKL